MSTQNRPVHGRQLSGLAQSSVLAGAGGFLDAFTYVGHGHVFANSMTGNVVLLGVNVIAGDVRQSLTHLLPIMSFLLGVSASKVLYASQASKQSAQAVVSVKNKLRNPDVAVLTAEIVILAALGFLPAATPDYWITICVAFAASVQTAIFREVEGHPYNSTFTTGNLRTLSESAFAWFTEGRGAALGRMVKVFSTICIMFLLGAIGGAFVTPRLSNRTLWLVCLPLGLLWMRLFAGLGRRHHNQSLDTK
jgi:uncharacterized membrane protein YoaK (UPF0700 family)